MKLATTNTVQKIRGHAKSNLYPQPEGTLGDTMQKHGKDLGEDSLFGTYFFWLPVKLIHSPFVTVKNNLAQIVFSMVKELEKFHISHMCCYLLQIDCTQ